MRVVDKSPLRSFTVYLAEDPGIFEPIGYYKELFKFEADIAQLTELLLLFCESPGSMVELGMFVFDQEVSPKLLVAIDSKNYQENSFIKLGPLFSLRYRHGDSTVCVLDLPYLNISDITRLERLDPSKLLELLREPLQQRLLAKREACTFDPNRHGHVTKLITGLVQHYACLTLRELEVLLFCLDVAVAGDELRRHVQCAERFGWLHSERISIDDYCAATFLAQKQAIDFDVRPEAPIKSRIKWRAQIREFWQSTDSIRFEVIRRAMRGGPR